MRGSVLGAAAILATVGAEPVADATLRSVPEPEAVIEQTVQPSTAETVLERLRAAGVESNLDLGLTSSPEVAAEAPPEAEARSELTASPEVDAAPAETPPIQLTRYRIQRGDTLGKIARTHATTVAEIQAANPDLVDPNRIRAGDTLMLPSQSYRVQAGDWLSRIAQRHGAGLDELLILNPDLAARPDRIRVGEPVILPVHATLEAAAPSSSVETSSGPAPSSGPATVVPTSPAQPAPSTPVGTPAATVDTPTTVDAAAEPGKIASFLTKLLGTEAWKAAFGKARTYDAELGPVTVELEAAAVTYGSTSNQRATQSALPKDQEMKWLRATGTAELDFGDALSADGLLRFTLPYAHPKDAPDPVAAASAMAEGIARLPLDPESALRMARGTRLELDLDLDAELSHGAAEATLDGKLTFDLERLAGDEVRLELGYDADLEASAKQADLLDGKLDVSGALGRDLERIRSFDLDLGTSVGKRAFQELMSLDVSAAVELAEAHPNAVELDDDRVRTRDTLRFDAGYRDGNVIAGIDLDLLRTEEGVTGTLGVDTRFSEGDREVDVELDIARTRLGTSATVDAEIDTTDGEIERKFEFDARVGPGTDRLGVEVTEEEGDQTRNLGVELRRGDNLKSTELSGGVSDHLGENLRGAIDAAVERAIINGERISSGELDATLARSIVGSEGFGFQLSSDLSYRLERPEDSVVLALPMSGAKAALLPEGARFSLNGGGKIGGSFEHAPEDLRLEAERGIEGKLSFTVTKRAGDEVDVQLRLTREIGGGVRLRAFDVLDLQSDRGVRATRFASYRLDLSQGSHRAAYDALLRGDLGPASVAAGKDAPAWQSTPTAVTSIEIEPPDGFLPSWADGSISLSKTLLGENSFSVRGNPLRDGNWVRYQGLVSPEAGDTQSFPITEGLMLRLGLEADALLAYQVTVPEDHEVPTPPLSAEQGRALPLGSDVLIRASGELQGIAGASYGAELLGEGLRFGAKAGIEGSLESERAFRVEISRLEGDQVRLKLTKEQSSERALEVFARLGLEVDSEEYLGDLGGLTQLELLKDLTDQIDEELADRLSAAFDHESSSSTEIDRSVSFELDLSTPEGRGAYESLLGLDAGPVIASLNRNLLGAETGVKLLSRAETEASQTQSRTSFEIAGESVFLREALRRDSTTIELTAGKQVREDVSGYGWRQNILGFDKDVAWEAVTVRVDDDPIGRSYYRLQWNEDDYFTSAGDVDQVVRLGERLGAQPAAPIRAENVREGLGKIFRSARHGETTARLELFFTEQAIQDVRNASAEDAYLVYGLETAERTGTGLPGWAWGSDPAKGREILSEYLTIERHPVGDDKDQRNALQSLRSAYWRATHRNIYQDADAFEGARAFAAMVERMRQSPDPAQWNRALADLGKELKLDFHGAVAGIARLTGTEQMVVHRLELQGDAVDIRMKDQGILERPTVASAG